MRVLRFDTSMEPMISRIPGLFPYLEFNEDWTTTLHAASDSFDGSWGKVVDSMRIPCNVNLCTYVQTDYNPSPYNWNSTNTFPTGENMEDEYSISSSEYIRRVEKYYYVEEEEEVGETYVEIDPFPDTVTSSMPNRIKVPKRDKENNYIYDCNQYKVYGFYRKEADYSYYKKICLINEGETYTYRTLIDYYYRYKDTVPSDNTFIKFMERGIGKVKVDKVSLQMTDTIEYPNVPDYIYLGQVKMLIEKYRKYQRICTYYRTHYLNFNKTDDIFEQKCDLYKTMGGDTFLRYLETQLPLLNKIAAEYKCYAENKRRDFGISLNVPLFQSKNDLGYLSCYMNEFIPGGHFRHGELVTYNGRTYICLLNRFLVGGNNYKYCMCNDDLYKLSANTYDRMSFGKVQSMILPTAIYNGYTYILFNNEYYEWQGTSYVNIEVTEYCSGLWNENLELNEFDYQHFVLLTDFVSNTASYLSIPIKTSLRNADEWYYDDNLYGNKFKLYITVPSLPHNFIYKNIKRGNNFYVWDETLQMYVPDTTNCLSYTIEGKADSLLKGLRKYEQFIDESELFDEPDIAEDWLYYYKIGNFFSNGSIYWDSVGNIERFGTTPVSPGTYVTDLMAYGTILTDIQCNTTDKTLTFTYVVNAHLKAILDSIAVDDDGNNIYKYRPFEYDSSDPHGIVYVETYNYTDTDIDDLVNNGDFRAFVEDRPNAISNYMQKYGYKRFKFSVVNSSTTVMVGNSEYEYAYVRSDFSETVDNDMDVIYQPLFKKDYFTGYAYEPTVKNNVDIRRGNAAAFERHIRFSECKTIEDLESEQNGSFYRMEE